MSPSKLVEILRERISEFGEKPSYILFPEELSAGRTYGLFTVQEPEDRGDGTVITKATFEGKLFICATEKTGEKHP
ncbi:MAG: hypothetical protein WCT45_02030 [Candidatus Paceibacterota bacterium]|jgi:hypothetical protein